MNLRNAKNLGLHVIQFESGKYGYVGSVPANLVILKADGSELSAAEFAEYRRSSSPSMVAKIHGYKQPTFETAEAAIQFANKKGYNVA